MDIEQQLRAAFAPCNPRPELRSSILARRAALGESKRGKGRIGSRTILFGTVLMLAAAAAMLTWLMPGKPKPESEPVPQLAAAPVVAAPAIETAAPAGDEPSSKQAPPVPQTAKVAVPEPVLPPVKPFTVELLPLQNGATDAGAKAAVDSFFATFVNDLRAVPGLTLLLSETDEPADVELPDYQLTVRGSGSDATNMVSISVAGDEKAFIEMKRKLTKEQRAQGAGFVSSMIGDVVPTCAPVMNGGDSSCRSPTAMAAYMVDGLRKHNFPADPSLKLQMQGKLFNASLDPRQRLQALTDIGSLKRSSPGGALQDPVVVRGAIALATTATDPAIRAQVWRAMRGSRSPDLVNPVITSLLQERDSEVRLQAVILLQQDFSADPRAREVLEVVAREESRPLVRALAVRALKGEEAWKSSILTSLKDASLTDAERIEAFMYHAAPPGAVPGSFSFSGALSRSPELFDDEAMQALTRLLPGAAKSPEYKQIMGSVLSSLGSLKQPAITEMFVGMLDAATEPGFRSAIVRQLALRGSDPAARAALEKVSSGDPDSNLRELAAKSLQGSPGG